MSRHEWFQGIDRSLPELSTGGVWMVLIMGGLLAAAAVLYLRRARKVGLLVSLLLLLVPISALAGVPFIFPAGTIADATKLNKNFAAVIPIIGKSTAAGPLFNMGVLTVFPASPSFFAPRNLTCVVMVQPYVVGGGGVLAAWAPAIKLGTTVTVAPPPGPAELSLVQMPVSFGLDRNYSGNTTEVFSVPAGSSVSFGARLNFLDSSVHNTNVTTVYSCTIPP